MASRTDRRDTEREPAGSSPSPVSHVPTLGERVATRGSRGLIVAVVIAVVVFGSSVGTAAQESGNGEPAATLTGAGITIDVGESRVVNATYRFDIERLGDGDAAIEGTMWRFPGRDVNDLSARVDGRSVDPSVTREARFVRIGVPVSDVDRGETVSIRLQYRISGPGDRLKTPLWVPEFGTTGSDRIVRMTVSLPDGTRAQTPAFPEIDSRHEDGRVARYRLLHVPGFVALPYGQSGELVTLDRLATIAGLLGIGGIFGGWTLYNRRAARREDRDEVT